MIDRALAAAAALVLARPRAVALALALVTAGALVALTRLRIDPDFSSFLPEGLEPVAWARAVEDGDSARTLLVVLRGAGVAERIPELAERLRGSPWVESVAATKEEVLGARLAVVRDAPLYFVDAATLEALERRLLAERADALAETRRVLAEDPLGGADIARRDPLGLRWIFDAAQASALPPELDARSPYLVGRDGTNAFLSVRGRRMPFDIDAARALLDDVTARLGEERSELFGGYVIACDDASRMRRDIIWATSSSVALVVGFLLVSLRDRRAPLLLVLPTATAVLWTLGYGGLLFGSLNPLAVSAAAVLTGLGVDFAIHYATRFAEERHVREAAEAIRIAGVRIGRPLLFGLLTTLAGFLSLAAGHFPGVRQFGYLLAVGLVCAFVATLFLLPLLLRRFGYSARGAAAGPVVALAQRLHESRAARPAAIVLLLLAGAGWTEVAVHGLHVDADPRSFRPADNPLEHAQLEFERRMGFSPLPLTVLVDPAVDVETLRAAFAAWKDEGTIAVCDGPPNLVPSPEARARVAAFEARIDGWVAGCLADLERAGLNPAPFRESIERWDTLFHAPPPTDGSYVIEARGGRFTRVTLFAPHAPVLREDRERIHGAIRARLGDGARILDPYALGDVVTPALRDELHRVLAISGVVILLLVLAGSGGVRHGVLALLPVAAGFGITLGALSVLDTPLNPGNFVAIPFLLGLGVDDGIHMMGRHRERHGDALATTGQAVWRTSATTLLGFGSLALARTPALASLGEILAVGILACFLTSVVALPAFLKRGAHE